MWVEAIAVDLTAHLKSMLYGFFRTVPCHRREERCFRIGGEAMPICSRCLFILIGMLFLPLFLVYPLPIYVGFVLQLPMMLDGWTQLKRWRTSTNALRSATGLMSGLGLSIGISGLFWNIIAWLP
ncbi:hypothetical protein ASG66_01690 [Bacillus sp. Leaf406]|nr:hypothetical protein ASG66_01690 [Bacillus sp. Leaf406]